MKSNERARLPSQPPPQRISTREVICRIWSSPFFRASAPAFCSIIFSSPRVTSIILTDGAPCVALSLIFTLPSQLKRDRKRVTTTHGSIALIREHYSATRAAYIVQYVLECGENLSIYSKRSDKLTLKLWK